MHVLIVPSWYKTISKPLAGTFFEEQARTLLRHGYKVGLLAPTFNKWLDGKLAIRQFFGKHQNEDFIDKEIPTYYIHSEAILPSRFKRINYWFACFRTNVKFKQYVKKHGMPDFIHAHSTFFGGVTANYIASKYKIPYFITEHFSGLIQNPNFYSDRLEKNIIEKVLTESKRTIIVSNFFKEELLLKYNLVKDKCVVLSNVLNPIFCSNFSIKEISKPFSILCVAFLTESKNHKDLFNAIELVVSRGYEVELKLVGDGPYKDQLVEYSKQKNISNRVLFLGNISRESVKSEIDNSHIVVSSSLFETFGVSLIESLACGRPVVSMDSGGPRDIVTKANGILVKERNPENLAQAIIDVIENYSGFNQKHISEVTIKSFSEDAVFNKLSKIYNE